MAKKYTLLFILRNRDEFLLFPVRESEQERLRSILNVEDASTVYAGFFAFTTVDGRGVAVNLAEVQAIRYLWDIAQFTPEVPNSEDDVEIYLCGKAEPLREDTEESVSICDFFSNLQFGAETVPFPQFEDVDGETIQFSAREIACVVIPKRLLDDGYRKLEAENE